MGDVDDKICTVSFPIDDHVKSKDIVFHLEKNILRIGMKAPKKNDDDDDDNNNNGNILFLIENEVLWKRVLKDDSYWEIDDLDGSQRSFILELSKRDVGPWDYFLQSDYVPPDTTITTKVYLDIVAITETGNKNDDDDNKENKANKNEDENVTAEESEKNNEDDNDD